jgi:hypothetical protein
VSSIFSTGLKALDEDPAFIKGAGRDPASNKDTEFDAEAKAKAIIDEAVNLPAYKQMSNKDPRKGLMLEGMQAQAKAWASAVQSKRNSVWAIFTKNDNQKALADLALGASFDSNSTSEDRIAALRTTMFSAEGLASNTPNPAMAEDYRINAGSLAMAWLRSEEVKNQANLLLGSTEEYEKVCKEAANFVPSTYRSQFEDVVASTIRQYTPKGKHYLPESSTNPLINAIKNGEAVPETVKQNILAKSSPEVQDQFKRAELIGATSGAIRTGLYRMAPGSVTVADSFLETYSKDKEKLFTDYPVLKSLSPGELTELNASVLAARKEIQRVAATGDWLSLCGNDKAVQAAIGAGDYASARKLIANKAIAAGFAPDVANTVSLTEHEVLSAISDPNGSANKDLSALTNSFSVEGAAAFSGSLEAKARNFATLTTEQQANVIKEAALLPVVWYGNPEASKDKPWLAEQALTAGYVKAQREYVSSKDRSDWDQSSAALKTLMQKDPYFASLQSALSEHFGDTVASSVMSGLLKYGASPFIGRENDRTNTTTRLATLKDFAQMSMMPIGAGSDKSVMLIAHPAWEKWPETGVKGFVQKVTDPGYVGAKNAAEVDENYQLAARAAIFRGAHGEPGGVSEASWWNYNPADPDWPLVDSGFADVPFKMFSAAKHVLNDWPMVFGEAGSMRNFPSYNPYGKMQTMAPERYKNQVPMSDWDVAKTYNVIVAAQHWSVATSAGKAASDIAGNVAVGADNERMVQRLFSEGYIHFKDFSYNGKSYVVASIDSGGLKLMRKEASGSDAGIIWGKDGRPAFMVPAEEFHKGVEGDYQAYKLGTSLARRIYSSTTKAAIYKSLRFAQQTTPVSVGSNKFSGGMPQTSAEKETDGGQDDLREIYKYGVEGAVNWSYSAPPSEFRINTTERPEPLPVPTPSSKAK